MIIHVIIEPNEIANGLIIIIGIIKYNDEWFWESGLDLIEFLLDINIIRKEYDAVIPIEDTIIIVNKHLSFDEIIISIIISLEKNPEENGNPIRAILVIIKVDITSGIL